MIRRLTSGSSVPAIGFCIFERKVLNEAYKSGGVPKLTTTDNHKKFFFAFNPVSYSENYKQRVNIHPTFSGLSAISDLGVGGNEIKLELEPHIYTNLGVPYANDDTTFWGRVGSAGGSWLREKASDMIGTAGGFARNGARELLDLLNLLYYCRMDDYEDKETGGILQGKNKYIPSDNTGSYKPINYTDYGYVFYDYDRGRIVEVYLDPSGITVSRSVSDKDTFKVSITMHVAREFGKSSTRSTAEVNTFPNPKNIIKGLANAIKDLTKIPGYFAGIVRDIADGVKQIALSGKEIEKAYKDSTKVWSTEMRAIKKDYHSTVKEIKNWGGNNNKDIYNSTLKKLSAGGRQLQSGSASLINSWATNMYNVMPGWVEDSIAGTDKFSQYVESLNTNVYTNPTTSGSSGSNQAQAGANNLITRFLYPYPSNQNVWSFSYGNEVDIKPDINDGEFRFKTAPNTASLPTNGSLTLDEYSGKITVRAYLELTQTTYTIRAYYKVDELEYYKDTTITLKIALNPSPITITSYKPNTSNKLLIFKNSFSLFIPEINGTSPFRFQLKSVLDSNGTETNTLPNGLTLDSFTGRIFGSFTESLTTEKSVVLLISNSIGQIEHTVVFKDELIEPTTMTFSHYSTPPIPPENYMLSLKKGDVVNISITHNANYVFFEVTPPLPTGITLDSSSGVISGTCEEVMSKKDYIFKVSNAKGSITSIMSIEATGETTPLDENAPTSPEEPPDELDQTGLEDTELELYNYARSSYFRLKELIESNSQTAMYLLSLYTENVKVNDELVVSQVFTDRDRYEIITDFNYIYLLGAAEYLVNFKAQFRIVESDDRFTVYKPTSYENFEQIAKRFYGSASWASQIASYNKMNVNDDILPPVLLIPFEDSPNLNIVNRIQEFNPPYSLDKVKNELLGYDLKLTQDRDFFITPNGDLDLMFGDEAVIQALTDVLSVPQGSFISDPNLGNPLPPEGELTTGDMIVDNSINLSSMILKDPRISSAVLISTEQDGDAVYYKYSVTTIANEVFTIEAV